MNIAYAVPDCSTNSIIQNDIKWVWNCNIWLTQLSLSYQRGQRLPSLHNYDARWETISVNNTWRSRGRPTEVRLGVRFPDNGTPVWESPILRHVLLSDIYKNGVRAEYLKFGKPWRAINRVLRYTSHRRAGAINPGLGYISHSLARIRLVHGKQV